MEISKNMDSKMQMFFWPIENVVQNAQQVSSNWFIRFSVLRTLIIADSDLSVDAQGFVPSRAQQTIQLG